MASRSAPTPRALDFRLERDARRARRRRRPLSRAPHAVRDVDVDDTDDANEFVLRRRSALACAVSTASSACIAQSSFAAPNGGLSDAWGAITGAPSDLVFPRAFEGNWLTTSRTASVDAPLGMEFIRDVDAFERLKGEVDATAREPFVYPVRFMENGRGETVFDRAFNVRALAEASRGSGGKRALDGEIEWNVDDPNVLKLVTGDGASVFYKVTARSSDRDDDARTMTTSELAQIVVDRGRVGAEPRVKSTRIVTKYKWRTPEEAKSGPQIVASQTVYEYLVAVGGGEDADETFVKARGRPVEVDVYRIAMQPWTEEFF